MKIKFIIPYGREENFHGVCMLCGKQGLHSTIYINRTILWLCPQCMTTTVKMLDLINDTRKGNQVSRWRWFQVRKKREGDQP